MKMARCIFGVAPHVPTEHGNQHVDNRGLHFHDRLPMPQYPRCASLIAVLRKSLSRRQPLPSARRNNDTQEYILLELLYSYLRWTACVAKHFFTCKIYFLNIEKTGNVVERVVAEDDHVGNFTLCYGT